MKSEIILLFLASFFFNGLAATPKDGERVGQCSTTVSCNSNNGARCIPMADADICDGEQTLFPGLCYDDKKCQCCIEKFNDCNEICKVKGIEGQCYNPYNPKSKNYCDGGISYDNECNAPTCACCIREKCHRNCTDPANGRSGTCVDPMSLLSTNKCPNGTFKAGLCGSDDCLCHFPEPCHGPCKDPKNGRVGTCLSPKNILISNKCKPGKFKKGLCNSDECLCYFPDSQTTNHTTPDPLTTQATTSDPLPMY